MSHRAGREEEGDHRSLRSAGAQEGRDATKRCYGQGAGPKKRKSHSGRGKTIEEGEVKTFSRIV